MASTTRNLRSYDHRLRDLVRSTGDIGHATQRGVPRSTARGWLTSTRAEVITLDVVDMDVLDLQQEVRALRKRVERLVALLRLVVVLTRVSGFSLACARLPDAAVKVSLLRAIERSRSVLPLRAVLPVLRLSQSRYHSWKREDECGLDDMPSCPRSSPQQLTRAEVETIKEMVTSEEYRHVPTGTLALLAQRLGKVFAYPVVRREWLLQVEQARKSSVGLAWPESSFRVSRTTLFSVAIRHRRTRMFSSLMTTAVPTSNSSASAASASAPTYLAIA